MSLFDPIGGLLDVVGVEPSTLPVIGGMFDDPAEEDLQRRMGEARDRFEAMRPQMADARMYGLRNQLTAFGPANRALAAMYGPQAAIDFAPLGQNPMANVFADPASQPRSAPGGAQDPQDPLSFGLTAPIIERARQQGG